MHRMLLGLTLVLAGCAHDDAGLAGWPTTVDGAAADPADATPDLAPSPEIAGVRAIQAATVRAGLPAPGPSTAPSTPAPTWIPRPDVAMAASRPDVLVVWTGGHGYRSGDGGRSWTPLALPNDEWATVLAADGTLVSFGDGRIVLDAADRGRREIAPPDGMTPHTVLVAGSWLVVVDRTWPQRVAWARLDRAPLAWRRARGLEEGVGSYLQVVDTTADHVDLLDVEVNTCGSSDGIDWQRIVRLDARGLRVRPWSNPALETRGGWAPGAHGWLYTLEARGVVAYRDGRLVTRIGGRRVDPPGYVYEAFASAVSDGGGLVAVYDGRLVRLAGARLRVLAAEVPDGFEVRAAADDGTVLGIQDHAVLRFTAARGFEPVAVP